MKNRTPSEDRKGKGIGGPDSVNMKRRNQNPNNTRKGLSLEAFAHARSNRSHYNPASIKKQQEFYKNAKYVSKFKKSMKQQGLSSASMPGEVEMNKKNKKSQNKTKVSLREIYEKKREEEEKARMEKEAAIQAKKEEIDKANAQRKATREKMFKKTRSGQPVMKYRIEHLLETIQGSKIYS
ncbi:hypothetical protein CsatA_027687 [Cannabis sativa]